MLAKNAIKATTDYRETVGSDVIFICVGTPSKEDGSVNLDYIFSAARSIGPTDGVVAVKSTVVPGTAAKIKEIVGPNVVSNPEFLREGNAIYDFMNPDKVVIGCDNDETFSVMKELYASFEDKIIRCNLETAEMIKYTNNAFLATKISFINEIANMCEKSGADVRKVSEAIGMDSRISSKFLRPGIGFGGSCFPKDVKALVAHAKSNEVETHVLDSVLKRNELQPLQMVRMLEKRIDLENSKISILGLSFKPDTDDVREAPALKIIDRLLESGSHVTVHDPKAMHNAQSIYGDKIKFADSMEEAISGSDAILLTTEWGEFLNLKDHTHSMRGNVVIDGRLMLNAEDFEGYDFGGVGHG
jgi:UDPglucose 6-dehydrogenase